MLTTFIICFSVVFIISFIICETLDSKHVENFMTSALVSFFILCLALLFSYNIKQDIKKDLQKCKETVSLIVPEIVYANDSSFKVLKYNHRNFPEKIIINSGDSLYNMNDSEYIVEPCSQTILKKRK